MARANVERGLSTVPKLQRCLLCTGGGTSLLKVESCVPQIRLFRVLLYLLDSQVNIAALTKHHSSSRNHQRALRPFFSEVELAHGCRVFAGSYIV